MAHPLVLAAFVLHLHAVSHDRAVMTVFVLNDPRMPTKNTHIFTSTMTDGQTEANEHNLLRLVKMTYSRARKTIFAHLVFPHALTAIKGDFI